MSEFRKLGTSADFADGSITGAKIADGTVANVDISNAAAIALSKLAPTTASKALASDSGGLIVASSTTATELGYISGVTSAIQTQFTNGLQVFKVTGVDGKATAATLIGTTANNGRQFYPLFVFSEVTAANTLSVAASASFGTNSASYNNILAITALTGLTALNATLAQTPITTAMTSIAPATGIYVKITTGAVATSCTMQFTVAGIYA